MASVFRKMSENFVWAADILAADRSKIRRIVFSGGIARKIELIRRLILQKYSASTTVSVARNETLQGLRLYGQKSMEGDRFHECGDRKN